MAHATLSTRLLTQADVERLIDIPTALRVVAGAFIAHSRGRVVMPAKVYLPLADGSDFRAMPAWIQQPSACGIKWVNVHPKNPRRGLPTVMALVILNDPATGFPLAVMDGTSITKIRTAAAAGVAARVLSRRDAKVAALIGCGAQALWQLRVLAVVRRLRDVRVWGAAAGEAVAFIRRARRHVGARMAPARSVREAVDGADLVVTLTPSREPLVQREWIGPGTHINAIGADGPGKQELDGRLLHDAVVVVDEIEQAVHGGEVNVPIARGEFSASDIHATLGDVLTGKADGRRSADQITIFDSTGIAVHDIALAHAVHRLALRRRLGRTVRLLAGPEV
jgi:alanine dehydrogenase